MLVLPDLAHQMEENTLVKNHNLGTSRNSLLNSRSAAGIVRVAAGLAVALEVWSQGLRFTIALAFAAVLAMTFGGGLYFSAQMFRDTVRSSREAVRNSVTARLPSIRLQTATRNSPSAQHRLQKDITALRHVLNRKRQSGDQRTTANN